MGIKEWFKRKPEISAPTDLLEDRSYMELDQVRIALWIALCKCFNPRLVWRTTQDHDGSISPGWFILGYKFHPDRQIRFFVPIEDWDKTNYATTRKRAPKHNGLTPADNIQRIRNLS
jgi:hypothetical protein